MNLALESERLIYECSTNSYVLGKITYFIDFLTCKIRLIIPGTSPGCLEC